MMNKRLKLVISLAIPLLVGGAAGFATSSSVSTWYVSLQKPFFNPPSYVFGPVWTILYILMGFSLYLVWSAAKSREQTISLIAFAVQLTLNFAWSFIFFYFRLPGLAFLEIALLLASIGWMIIAFKKVTKLAAYLQVPYLMWVSFAFLLNAAIWILNYCIY